jgi:hypothetical protein
VTGNCRIAVKSAFFHFPHAYFSHVALIHLFNMLITRTGNSAITHAETAPTRSSTLYSCKFSGSFLTETRRSALLYVILNGKWGGDQCKKGCITEVVVHTTGYSDEETDAESPTDPENRMWVVPLRLFCCTSPPSRSATIFPSPRLVHSVDAALFAVAGDYWDREWIKIKCVRILHFRPFLALMR